MTETVDIVTFLRARLDEDQRIAEAATAGPWEVDDEQHAEQIRASDGVSPVAGSRWGGEASVFESPEDAVHIARHDPARVLAEAAAKRAILGMCVRPPEDDGDGALWVPGGGGYGEAWVEALLALVQVYSGHPDFDPAWRLP